MMRRKGTEGCRTSQPWVETFTPSPIYLYYSLLLNLGKDRLEGGGGRED